MGRMRSIQQFIKILSDIYRKTIVQVAVITLAFLLMSALAVNYFEYLQSGSNINSVWDGVWWAIVTMGTVGYGDKYPVTVGGRMVGIFLIFTGVGLMSLFTATIASTFVERRMKEGRGLETIKVKEHIIICGWNEHTDNVILGLTTYGAMKEKVIVLINELTVDEIDTLRPKYSRYNLKFLRGDYVHEEVLLRANVSQAKFVLIMADQSGGHPRERSDERTALAALTVKLLAPQVKTIAELLEGESRPHLKRANVDEIVVRGEHIGSLLASAINSPGLPRVISSIVSLGGKDKLWRTSIPSMFVNRPFKELSSYYREKDHAILIGIMKEKKAIKLADILSDNTSMIDTFIREKIRESKKEFSVEKDAVKITINPDDDYVIAADELAVVLSRSVPDL
ncbi:MAG: N-terminal protein [Thermodesulfobacteriota bacterium]|nr:N-terminal protein [Thermodesulfobacteriota bacterium]